MLVLRAQTAVEDVNGNRALDVFGDALQAHRTWRGIFRVKGDRNVHCIDGSNIERQVSRGDMAEVGGRMIGATNDG